jgi:hypothetical protein
MYVLLRFLTLLNRGGAIYTYTYTYIIKSLQNIYSLLYNIFERKNQGFPILWLECNVNSESSNNIFYFSDDNPENNEGNNSNSNDNSENMEDSRNSEDNTNPENNEDSNRDSSMDLDDPVDSNVEEIKDPQHNAPERIINDLEQVDKARKYDPDALDYLRREYNAFFDGVPVKEALKDIEEYLEKEFKKSLYLVHY